MTLKVTLFRNDGKLERGGSELLNQAGIRWIDVQKPDEETLMQLKNIFGLHRLAIEDCLHLDQRPKLEEYAGHHFVVLQSFSSLEEDLTHLSLHEQHFFMGKDWLISVHELPARSFQEVDAKISQDAAGTIGRGPDFLFYLLADALVDLNFPVLERLNEELDELELSIFSRPKQSHLERAFQLKRMLVRMRRVLAPQREVIERLARQPFNWVSEKTRVYFRDIDDHLLRVHEQLDSARDLLSNAIEGYLSVVANRTGEITKQLTIFASIFLPLSFLTGFFGQNFAVLSTESFLWLVIGLSIALPVFLLAWFRYREWI